MPLWLVVLATLGGAQGWSAPAPLSVPPDAQQYRTKISPAPNWVTPPDWNNDAARTAGFSAQFLLEDNEDRITANGRESFHQYVVRILTSEGATQFAQQTFEITPEFEEFTLHRLMRHRGGAAVDLLPTTAFKRLQRETQLEAQIMTGRITLAAVLDDIEVGDVLEIAYTITEHNPLFSGRHGTAHRLGSSLPVARERIVVHAPEELDSLRVWTRVPEGTTGLPERLFSTASLRLSVQDTTEGGERLITWDEKDLPAIPYDSGLSARSYPFCPMLHVTGFRSWGDVVDWALPLFSEADTVPPALAERLNRWQSEPDEDRRFEQVVRWVQDDIRYFGLELGEHTLRPRLLHDVCASRFGDCKDKALLLTALLRALHFEAWPALANTYWRSGLRQVRPDAADFNHAVVACRRHGELCWIDPTIPQQHADHGRFAFPPYGAALIVRPGEHDLTACVAPPDTAPDTDTRDQIQIDPSSGDGTLTTEVAVRGLQADAFRLSLLTRSAEQQARDWFNFISTYYPELEEIKAPEAEDQPTGDTIVIRAKYRLPGLLHTGEGRRSVTVVGYDLRAVIDPPNSRRRHWPYTLPSGRHVRHRIEAELPFEASVSQSPEAVRAPGLTYTLERATVSHRLTCQHELWIQEDDVPATKMAAFADDVQEILNSLATIVRERVIKASAAPPPSMSGTPANSAILSGSEQSRSR